MPPLPKAILFDLDETIVSFADRRETLITVGREFAEFLGPLTAEDIADVMESSYATLWSDPVSHKIWRFRMKDSRVHTSMLAFEKLRDRAPLLTPELAQEFGERFHELREFDVTCFPGAIETLDELRRRGIKLALITNGHSDTQRRKLDQFDLNRRFEHIQIEGEVGFGKPEPQAYIHAMERLGVWAKDTWMVGDNLEWEVAAPQRLGIYSIWHDHRRTGLPPGSSVKPDRIVTNISELLEDGAH